MLTRIARLPRARRQPALVFAISRLLGAPESGWDEYRAWLLAHEDRVVAEACRRTMQTNEPLRCAALLPALALLAGGRPLALAEVGAAAGLCLCPDRYAYRYDDRPVLGSSPLVLECVTNGRVPLPARVPSVAGRAGADLHPLRLDRPRDVRWLRALVPPGAGERLARLDAAVRIVAARQPRVLVGDAVAVLPRLLAHAAADGAVPVVVASGTLVYLDARERERLCEDVRELGAHLVTLEAPAVLPCVQALLPDPPPREAPFVLAIDGEPLAFAHPHGRVLHWLAGRG